MTPIKRARSVRYRFPDPPHSGRDVLDVTGLTKSFGDRTIWAGVDLGLRRERLLVLGLNGAGKTTLLRILAGVELHDAGDVTFGTGVSGGYYAGARGHHPGRTVLDHLSEGALVTETDRRGALGAFGLVGDVAHQDAGTLSGGEKTKLARAAGGRPPQPAPARRADEQPRPAPSRIAVAEALGGWPGTIVLVSHDPEFVEALAPDLALLLPDGDIDYWSTELLDLVPLA